MFGSIVHRLRKAFSAGEASDELETFLRSNVAGFFPSYALSLADEEHRPNDRLISLSLAAIELSFRIDLTQDVSLFPAEVSPQHDVIAYANVYPGEHYRLLAAIVDVLKPKLVVEIGTYRGISALSMKSRLQPEAKVITYDVIPWYQISGTALKEIDFDSQLQQRVHDLAEVNLLDEDVEILKRADMVFVDAAKDSVMEKKFCALFDRIVFDNPPIVIFDDIRMLSMVELWRRIPYPKIDMTSFGHWSGTGIVEWGNSGYDQSSSKQWVDFLITPNRL